MIKSKKTISIVFIVLLSLFVSKYILPQETNDKGVNGVNIVEVVSQIKQYYKSKEFTKFKKKAYCGISILLAFGLIYNGIKTYLYYNKTGQFKFGIFIVNLILFYVMAIVYALVNK